MVAGHFGFAAAVKSREQPTPLWALMLACQWLDVVFVPFFLTGSEGLTPVPGTSGGYGRVIITADYTHSLVGALVLSVVFGLVFALWWERRSAIVLAGVVFSHWLLDLVVHRGDMAILPGNIGGFGRVGLGLWRFPSAASGLELALILAGSYLYWRAAVAISRSNKRETTTANIASALLLASGLITLTIDLLG
jgi:hypothetical protein